MFVTDMNGLCRVCLNDSESYSHIYEEQFRNAYLYVVLNDVCQLDVKMGDGLPEFVCCECYERISQFESFKQQSHEGNATLQRMKCDLEKHGFRLEQETDYTEVFAVEPEVEITVETEKSLNLDNSSDDGDNRDLEVSGSPLHLDKSGSDVPGYKGDNKRSREWKGVRKSIQRKGEGKKGFRKGNVENTIPCEGTRNVKTVSSRSVKPDIAVLKDNKTQSVRHGKSEELTSKIISCSASKFDKRKHQNVELSNVEKGCASVSASVINHLRKGDDLKGKSNEVKKGKDKGLKGEKSSECKRLKCEDCGEEFDNKLGMLNHTKVHYGVDNNGCKLGNGFTVAGRKLQLRKEDGEKDDSKRSYKCSVCNKMFYRIRHLKLHLVIHSGKRQFKCKSCEKEFLYIGHLKVHERLHTGEKPFECKVCNKSFYNSSNLKVHERVHTGEKPYKCNLCDKEFSHSNRLRAHEKVHAGKNKGKLNAQKGNQKVKEIFKCELCGKDFYQKGNLRMHEKWHLRQKIFQCDLCKKEFTEMRHLKRHGVVHTREKPFKCNLCEKVFSYSHNLKVHERMHK